ncbi:MAG: hypothetical protein BWY71_01944 [Planctomycetes bacterium ADurb.Bin412]|nr:MAG: hypothetical protein BWY71_01944 [Planctomycetes bacterium ADurb.Bin412]
MKLLVCLIITYILLLDYIIAFYTYYRTDTFAGLFYFGEDHTDFN